MINPLDMTGKTVLVTGASSGIGRETAILLSQLGARLVLVARNKDRLEETAADLTGHGHHVKPFDLTDADEIPSWMKSLAVTIGPLHGVVHSAGITKQLPIRSWTSTATDQIMEINVMPCFGLARGLRQRDVHASGASMVFVSSTAGLVGAPSLSVYSASKGAIIGLTKSLALELVRDEIRVNCIAPGLVETELVQSARASLTDEQSATWAKSYPLGIGKPRDVAHAIVFLLAETGRWITGTTLVLDGGLTAQ